ncbi:MAG: hypothetical protein EOP88_09355, partial [Verrucomicrobiaceae bacterium]
MAIRACITQWTCRSLVASSHITRSLPLPRAATQTPQAKAIRLPGRKALMKTFPSTKPLLLIPLLASGTTTMLQAQDNNKVDEAFEKFFGFATLYKDDSNPYLEEFKLRGRYHGQYWDVDADQGSQSDWEDRRSRFGFDAKLFEKKVEVRADFQSNDGFNDIYDGLVDAYIRWKPNSNLSFTAGKMKPLIGQYDFLESTNT